MKGYDGRTTNVEQNRHEWVRNGCARRGSEGKVARVDRYRCIMPVTKEQLIIALRALYEAVIAADGQLAKNDPQMQNALRMAVAALMAAGR